MNPIPDEDWQPIRDYTEGGPTDEDRQQAVEAMPVGSVVVGRVLAHLRMGYFVALGSKVVGQVEVISMKEPGEPVDDEDWPEIGTEIRAVVLGHTPGQQVRLTTRPSAISTAR